jgi:hypothetical protein
MACIPTGFVSTSDYPFVYPVGIIVGNVGGQQNLGFDVWNFDTSGNSYQINTTFSLKPQNFYTVTYEFSVTGTVALPALPHTLVIILRDVLGLIQTPPLLTIPINEYTSGNTGVFQAVYSGNLTLDADFNIQNTSNGFQWEATLIPNPAQVGDTGLSMSISKLTIQQQPLEAVISVTSTTVAS